MRDKKKVLRELYILGYEVGYYGHLDTVGWVRKEKERLIEEGVKLGVKGELLVEIYERGVSRGRREKERKISFMLGKEFLERIEEEIGKEKGALYQVRMQRIKGILRTPEIVYGAEALLRPSPTIKPPSFLYYLPKAYRRRKKREGHRV